MRRPHRLTFLAVAGLCAFSAAAAEDVPESLWVEAEHFDGIRDYCWPMGTPAMRTTQGNWGLSGPGWAAEWCQGGESGFLSIATGADDDKAAAAKTVEIPAAGEYSVWIRYGDWREATERFQLEIEQPGQAKWQGRFGEKAVVEEDNEIKLYFGWAFAWAMQKVVLKKGGATLRLVATTKDAHPRQIDVVVLTTDRNYRPRIKERPARAAWQVLDGFRKGIPAELEPLARQRPSFEVPPEWRLATFRDGGFIYLWNVSHTDPLTTWLSDSLTRVKVPYNIADANVRSGFEKMFAGRSDVPIFSDPRIVPTFHGVGAGIFATDPTTGDVKPLGRRFAAWLDQNPGRSWAMMMNYHSGAPIGEKGIAAFTKYRDRYVGSIAGESLGYFEVNADAMKQATAPAQTRRQLAQAFTPLTLAANAEKYRKVYGRDVDKNAYADVISCLSVGNIAFVPLCYDWGARIAGYESTAATSSLLPMRWAFMRGAARQHGGLTATYRSCNFGDSSTIFSDTQSFHAPRNIFDNYYSVFSGAGMTWYKMDLWYEYMAGSSMFYHEQGFDEFWQPGGTAAAGLRDVALSPKGELVDRFLRVTAAEPDRGTPFTPIAFLVDYAHGWEPAPFWPNSFKNWHAQQDRFRYDAHEKMLEEYFWTAYYPIGREAEKPMTGTNEVYVPGVFGDLFDVIYAYPDVAKWKSIDSYPVVICAGDIELTAEEGTRLNKYVERGGTLLIADAQMTGPGLVQLELPPTREIAETAGYRWLGGDAEQSQRFRPREIVDATESSRPLCVTLDGKAFCSAIDRGKGRLIYLAIPRGLGVDQTVHPVVPRLFAHLSRGLMPIEVFGDVEWLVNRNSTGWLVTLLNPAGQAKPQHGITPTDYREGRNVTIRARVAINAARDILLPDEPLEVKNAVVSCEVPAGGVRLIELK